MESQCNFDFRFPDGKRAFFIYLWPFVLLLRSVFSNHLPFFDWITPFLDNFFELFIYSGY
jgi:hypothetical protein